MSWLVIKAKLKPMTNNDGHRPPWHDSTRRKELPKNWGKLRLLVKRRAGGQCEISNQGFRCGQEGSECHHIGDRLDHTLANLQWVCRDHHQQETQASARTAANQAIIDRGTTVRPPEKHPGLIDRGTHT